MLNQIREKRNKHINKSIYTVQSTLEKKVRILIEEKILYQKLILILPKSSETRRLYENLIKNINVEINTKCLIIKALKQVSGEILN